MTILMEIIVIIILFVAAFIRSFLGFGDAVIAMPLLALFINLQTATPVVALCASTIGFMILLKNHKKADFSATLLLILSSLAGIPLGLYILKNFPDNSLKGILGLLLILYGIYRIIKPHWTIQKREKPFALLCGFLAGILGGAYNTNGPPVVIYGSLRQWPKENFRATLQGYFLPTGLMILAGHGLSGLWTSDVLKLFIFALPFVCLGIYLGGKAHKSIPDTRFYLIINIVIILMGGVLVLRAFLK